MMTMNLRYPRNSAELIALRKGGKVKPAYVSPPPPMPTQHIQNTNCSTFGNQMHCTTSGY
ncbi:hypothetical protein WS88_27180 [Burkholderia cepacia]|nr:hypothetical protein WS88_27180 [Burkholderia cepacia]